ncbi:type III secretion system cytoplasmic ring protein SctQ [Hyphomicrobium sp. MC1]|uniref:type III secretion system cytoplasmic ring protein SctQ n=1 Tax=Hyphomicrobium sp. (strain MC1) TaxID=717785 RepID=UPI000213EFDB|nr:type III secretion system cytoplasmic ring protein SctQ [Hyphomicrobium sp. MC1]CCB66680.1 putative AscQ protein [Hyphomicrobium sp. MC1]
MIDLPEISLLAANAATRLALRLPVQFDLGGQLLHAELAGQDLPGVPANWRSVQAGIGRGSALVHLDPSLLPQTALDLWPEAEMVGVPEDLRTILRGVLLSDLATQIEQYVGERIVWTDSDDALRPHRMALRRVAANEVWVASVALDDAGLHWLADRIERLPPLRSALDDLPVMLILRLDDFRMTQGELAGLEIGDVVLLDREPFTDDGGLMLVASLPNGAGWRTELKAGTLSILSILDKIMNNPEEASPDALDDLPIEVACEVGRITLSLAELREIAPGQVLDLGLDATEAISLRVNGHVAAMGELVRIADRVGIRLTDVKGARR